MNYEEHVTKALLRDRGLAVPNGHLATAAPAVVELAQQLGPCVVKAQVPAGGRGKAGGVLLAGDPQEAGAHAETILGMTIGPHTVERVLVEEQLPIVREMYVAIINDSSSRGPLILFSATGGMEVESAAGADPSTMQRLPVSIVEGCTSGRVRDMLTAAGLQEGVDAVGEFICELYEIYRSVDAELLEVNPLVLIEGTDRPVALDGKLTIDDSARARQSELAEQASVEPRTELERMAAAEGLAYIELSGNVGILANGAGLTMTTMDAVAHFGGQPANFLEIGGDAYTKSHAAVKILLQNPRVRSVLVNFCGAFARTDVMADGVVRAWKDLSPAVPIFFSIHGTGEDEANQLVRDRLGIDPFDEMDDAVRAAIAAAGS